MGNMSCECKCVEEVAKINLFQGLFLATRKKLHVLEIRRWTIQAIFIVKTVVRRNVRLKLLRLGRSADNFPEDILTFVRDQVRAANN
jgi:hypothetical protein